MYATDFFVLTRLTPIASNCRYAIVPVESCVNVWSMRMEISEPGISSPLSRCADRIFWVRFIAMRKGLLS